MKTCYCLGLLTTVLFVSEISVAQQPAPPLKDPVVRPRYLTIIQTGDAEKLLKTISDIVMQGGFRVELLDPREQQLEATRADDVQSKGYDKVTIWLERDFHEPYKYVKLFFFYERYREILAWKKDFYSVVISPSEEEERIGKLRQSLISLSTTEGE